MRTVDKIILFIIKFISLSVFIGLFAFIFMAIGMGIMGVDFDIKSKWTTFQFLFVLGFTGLPVSITTALIRLIMKMEKEATDA